MPTEFSDKPDVAFVGMYIGVVVKNDDPKHLGRVRVRIEGLVDLSCWAYPLGGVGGGSFQRGFYDVPEEKADVAVWFHQGDIDVPFYTPAHWGRTKQGCETPQAACEAAPADASKVKTYETARYQMVWDEREGQEMFKILDKVTGDFVSMDPSNGITLKSPLKVVVDAPKLYLGGDNLDENPLTGEGVVTAACPNPFTGQTLGALGGASTRVFVKKT